MEYTTSIDKLLLEKDGNIVNFVIEDIDRKIALEQIKPLLKEIGKSYLITVSEQITEEQTPDYMVRYKKNFDIQRVVRCKECEHFMCCVNENDEIQTFWCGSNHRTRSLDFFCADGTPKREINQKEK